MESTQEAWNKRHKTFSSQQYAFLLAQAEAEIKSTDLEEARELAKKAGLSIDSDLPALVRQHKDGTVASALTGGHSNTDHIVVLTGDYTTDRITELRRNLLTRCRAEQPESRGEDRWDKPRVPGERRRRIVREKDLPSAPPEPPPSGYIVFLGQMTTKIRHDRRHERHSQTKGMYVSYTAQWNLESIDALGRIWNINGLVSNRNQHSCQLTTFTLAMNASNQSRARNFENVAHGLVRQGS